MLAELHELSLATLSDESLHVLLQLHHRVSRIDTPGDNHGDLVLAT